MESRSVLVVGAGSVGQVFGRHLAQGGASLTFFVRDKYRVAALQGFDLFPLTGARAALEAAHFSGFDVISELHEVSLRRFTQVYLALPSTAVRAPWLGALIATLGDATIVSLQPSRDDLQAVRAAGATADALVAGGIGLISYAAPLPGETRFAGAGTAYWFPPFVRSLFSGPAQRTQAVIDSLQRGGLPARGVADVHRTMAFPNAVGMTYLTALEAAGWSVRKLHGGPLLGQCCEAIREVIPIVESTEGAPPVGIRALALPSVLRSAFWVGQRVAPFPLEAYLTKHFTKVGAQTRLIVASLIAQGRAAGLSVAALQRLSQPDG